MRNACLACLFVLAGCVEPPSVVIEPLRVINWAPASGAICVDPSARVLVTFSDDIVIGTLTSESLQLRDAAGPVETSLAYNKTTFTASLTTAEPLDYDTLYSVVAAATLEGVELGTLPVEVSSAFQTISTAGCTPPPECQLASDCADGQVCSSIGRCIDECVTDRDCPNGTTCQSGDCL